MTFFYTAAALSHIYRFAVRQSYRKRSLVFEERGKAGILPGTFDPFSLSHKGIVTAIRIWAWKSIWQSTNFSWSKKTQPSLIRRQIVSMSVADEFTCNLFPP